MSKKPVPLTEPDLISRYREEEVKEAEALLASTIEDCERRLASARGAYGKIQMEVIADRLRLRWDCSLYDKVFADVVLPRLSVGNFKRVEVSPATKRREGTDGKVCG